MRHAFLAYFCCPAEYGNFHISGTLPADEGFFRFGPDAVCYGRIVGGQVVNNPAGPLEDVLRSTAVRDGEVLLPFNPDDAMDNLRFERYRSSDAVNGKKSISRALVRNAYYSIRPLLPVPVRKHLQRRALRGWDRIPFPRWPVDHTVEHAFDRMMALALRASGNRRVPFIWFWPDGHSSAAVMTHDVETAAGRDFCSSLMDLNDSFRIKSSFQVVPEQRYEVPADYLESIRQRGFEINVHDLNHDGNLFRDHREFLRRAARINEYGRKFGAMGYRSGVLYRNLDWYGAFDFSYDMSVPNVGHLDPQPGGCCTTKPYFIGSILEIPVTLTQDYSLFNILREYSIDLWKKQLASIQKHYGMASFIVHPDYVIEQRARGVYTDLLAYLAMLRDERNCWITLPKHLDLWWRQRNKMTLASKDGDWRIEGPGKERASIAYATLQGNELVYEVPCIPTLAGGSSAQVIVE